MKVIVTGAAGYLGSVVTQLLLAEEHSVIAVDTLARGGRGLRGFVGHREFQFIKADVVDWVPVKADRIIHLAGISGAQACDADVDRAYAVNVTATKRLLDTEMPMVFASTCSLFDKGPVNTYTRTKAEAEAMVLAASGTALRFGTLCGPSANTRYDLFLNNMVLRAFNGLSMDVYEPDAMRPWLHVWDAAHRVCLMAVGTRNIFPAQFSVVGENLSKRKCVELVQARFPEFTPKWVNTGPDRRDYSAPTVWASMRTAGAMIDNLVEAMNIGGR